MKIKELIKCLGALPNLNFNDFEVKGISCNSKSVAPGYLFVAIKGNSQDGNKFIEEALSKGAGAVLVGSSEVMVRCQKKIPLIKVKDTRKALARLAADFYGNPSRKLKVVGVTGTNGKTTITYLIEAIAKEAGECPAVIGTINYRFKDEIIPSKKTTPGPLELQSMLARMLAEGVSVVAMEVSSHALDQERTLGIDFHSAVFTNLTQDHLDYHMTLENYFQAKKRFFVS